MNRRALLAALATGAASAVAGCTDGFDSLETGRSDRDPYGVDDREFVDPEPDDDPEEEDSDDPFRAGLIVDTLVDDEQRIGFEAINIPEGVEELRLELDLTVLEDHGVRIDEPELHLEFVDGPELDDSSGLDLEVTAYENGVLSLTLTTLEEPAVGTMFWLSGLETGDAGSASGLEYEFAVLDHAAEKTANNQFDLVDLDDQQPTITPEALSGESEDQQQWLQIEWLQPDGDAMRLDLDLSALEEYGSLEDVGVERDNFRSTTLEETTIEGATVSLELTSETDSGARDGADRGHTVVEGSVFLTGIDISVDEPVEEVVYGATLEGVVDDDAEVEPFPILQEYDDEPAD